MKNRKHISKVSYSVMIDLQKAILQMGFTKHPLRNGAIFHSPSKDYGWVFKKFSNQYQVMMVPFEERKI